MMNKKGQSLGNWTEAGVAIVLITIVLAIIVVSLNVQYSKNYDATFGFSSNSTKAEFESYQSTLQQGTAGEADSNALNGVSLTTTWGIIKFGLTMVWNLVSGQWINNSIALLQWGAAGTALAWALRLVFIFSIGFILLKILFRIKP